jgi:hypothetical protein
LKKSPFSAIILGMKKLFLSLICGLCLTTGVLSASAVNDNVLPLDEINYDSVMTDDNAIYSILKGKKDGTENYLQDIFKGNTTNSLIFRVNMVLGAVAILFLAILGLKFVVSQGDEDHVTKYKTQFGYIIMGLAIISVAEFMAFGFLDPSTGSEVLNNTNLTTAFYERINQIKLFIEIIVIGIVLIKMLMSGYDLIVRSEQDEAISKEKTFFRSFLFGTILILLAEVVARVLSGSETKLGERTINLDKVGADVAGGVNVGILEITGLINFALSFIAVMSVVMLILASVYYVLSFGDSEQMGRAKRIVVSCSVGAIVAVSAFTIARFAIG